MQKETFNYDNRIVKNFAWATVVWGIVGMLVGVIIATQLFEPYFNFNTRYISFGRLRPLHTNAIIFAFVGNAIFMGVYYSLQRLLKARMFVVPYMAGLLCLVLNKAASYLYSYVNSLGIIFVNSLT